MLIKCIEIAWQNYLDMADEADALNTDERFRHLHGPELDAVKAAHPELNLEDDSFTGIDEKISSLLAKQMPQAKIRIYIRDGWDEPDSMERMVWELSEVCCSCEQMTALMLNLSREFPKIRFRVTVLEPAEDPLAAFNVSNGSIQNVVDIEKTEDESA